jgi:hypothetical protein
VGSDEPAGGVEDLHTHGIDVHGHRGALGVVRHRVVRAVNRDQAVLLHRAGLAPRGRIRDGGQRDEARLFLGVRRIDPAPGRAVGADVGDGVEPLAELRAQIVPGPERACAQEVLLEGAATSRCQATSSGTPRTRRRRTRLYSIRAGRRRSRRRHVHRSEAGDTWIHHPVGHRRWRSRTTRPRRVEVFPQALLRRTR